MTPVTRALDKLSQPSEQVRWLMKAGPIAERLNRDSKFDVFPRDGGRANNAPPSDDE